MRSLTPDEREILLDMVNTPIGSPKDCQDWEIPIMWKLCFHGRVERRKGSDGWTYYYVTPLGRLALRVSFNVPTHVF